MRERLKEHRKAVEKGDTRLSGIAEHAFEAHHEIDWDSVQILDQESNHARRLVRECMHIRTFKPSMNRERGMELAVPFLRLLTRGNQSTPAPAGDDVTGPPPTEASQRN